MHHNIHKSSGMIFLYCSYILFQDQTIAKWFNQETKIMCYTKIMSHTKAQSAKKHFVFMADISSYKEKYKNNKEPRGKIIFNNSTPSKSLSNV